MSQSLAPLFPSVIVKQHSQQQAMSCAASAIEVILKCHRKIDHNDFSLQAKYGDTNIGFGKPEEYQKHGIEPVNTTKPIREGLEEIAREVAGKRFPAVSLPIHRENHTLYYHIFIAEESAGGIRLVDPATAQWYEGSVTVLFERITTLKQILRDPHPTVLNYQVYAISSV